MKYMRSNVAFVLFYINLILISISMYLILLEGIKYFGGYSPGLYYLRRTKEKQLNINPHYFLDNEKDSLNQQLKLRRYKYYPNVLAVINVIPLCGLMFLLMTFWVTKNECCTSYEDINSNFPIGSCFRRCICCSNCRYGERTEKCDCCNNCNPGVIVFCIFLFPIAIVYCIIMACGKNAARVFSVIILMCGDLIMSGCCFLYTPAAVTWAYVVMAIYFINFIINFLAILLPNITRCNILSIDYEYSMYEKNISPSYDIENNKDENSFNEPTYPNGGDIELPINGSENEVPYYNSTNQGYDNNNYGNAFDAPAPGIK